ncbi:hypothetical protein LI328DRAFT_44484 [Trichoderma asperelloides]|nr:hypothetical protein LI328DRAFT_44484 [Trichoderma asperelloides]
MKLSNRGWRIEGCSRIRGPTPVSAPCPLLSLLLVGPELHGLEVQITDRGRGWFLLNNITELLAWRKAFSFHFCR